MADCKHPLKQVQVNIGTPNLDQVRTLVDQLDGLLEVRSGQGVAYFLTFERIKHSGYGPDERPRGGG